LAWVLGLSSDLVATVIKSLIATIHSSYIKNNRGFNTPRYEIEVNHREQILEWLPMFGKKIRVFYHGMPHQCNGCYQLGHMKSECTNEKQNWKTYVNQLRDSGKFEKYLFGSWLD
jgi:hypothetical protein